MNHDFPYIYTACMLATLIPAAMSAIIMIVAAFKTGQLTRNQGGFGEAFIILAVASPILLLGMFEPTSPVDPTTTQITAWISSAVLQAMMLPVSIGLAVYWVAKNEFHLCKSDEDEVEAMLMEISRRKSRTDFYGKVSRWGS